MFHCIIGFNSLDYRKYGGRPMIWEKKNRFLCGYSTATIYYQRIANAKKKIMDLVSHYKFSFRYLGIEYFTGDAYYLVAYYDIQNKVWTTPDQPIKFILND